MAFAADSALQSQHGFILRMTIDRIDHWASTHLLHDDQNVFLKQPDLLRVQSGCAVQAAGKTV
jgi:hypothetical protein